MNESEAQERQGTNNITFSSFFKKEVKDTFRCRTECRKEDRFQLEQQININLSLAEAVKRDFLYRSTDFRS